MHNQSKAFKRAVDKFKKLDRLNRLIDEDAPRAQEARKELKRMSMQWSATAAGVGTYWLKKNSNPGIVNTY